MIYPYNIILAMREPYLSQILSGKKTVEVRRTRPNTIPCMVFLYHRGKIYGSAEVNRVEILPPGRTSEGDKALREACKRFAWKACLTEDEMYRYLNLAPAPTLYGLEAAQAFARPIEVPCRPQSWQYMTEEIMQVLRVGKEDA